MSKITTKKSTTSRRADTAAKTAPRRRTAQPEKSTQPRTARTVNDTVIDTVRQIAAQFEADIHTADIGFGVHHNFGQYVKDLNTARIRAGLASGGLLADSCGPAE